jgi:Meckel syndrome type 1 protein
MNEMPPEADHPEEVDELYRQISARDSSRPSEQLRRAVLAHAAQLAGERSRSPARHAAPAPGRRAVWRPLAFGALAAAALGGLMIAPRFMIPRTPETAAESAAATPPRDVPPPSAQALPSSPAPPVDMERTRPSRAADERVAARAPAAKETAQESAAYRATAPVTQPPQAAGRAQAADQRAEARLAAAAPHPREDSSANSAAPAFAGAARSADANSAADPSVALRLAAEDGDLATLAALLEGRTDIDARDSLGRTALLLATLHGRLGAVETLLAHGADPNAADSRGTTPLQTALAADQPLISELLKRYGAR